MIINNIIWNDVNLWLLFRVLFFFWSCTISLFLFLFYCFKLKILIRRFLIFIFIFFFNFNNILIYPANFQMVQILLFKIWGILIRRMLKFLLFGWYFHFLRTFFFYIFFTQQPFLSLLFPLIHFISIFLFGFLLCIRIWYSDLAIRFIIVKRA